MIDRSITLLNLLIAAFVAGAVVCAVGLAFAIIGYPLNSANLFPVFAAVGLFVASNRLSQQVGAEHEREKVRLEGDKLRNQKVAAEIETRVAPVAIEPDEAEADTDTSAEWRTAADRFVVAGSLFGFQVRRIAAGEHKVIEWQEWHIMRDFLIEAGVLSIASGTSWADGWNYDNWRLLFPKLALPFREGLPPKVEITPNAQRLSRLQQAQQTREGVVEGVRAD